MVGGRGRGELENGHLEEGETLREGMQEGGYWLMVWPASEHRRECIDVWCVCVCVV